MPRTSRARTMTTRFVPYVVVSVVHLVTLAVPFEAAQVPTKALLMPLLAEALYSSLRGGDEQPDWFPLVLVALVFSWLGDMSLAGDGDGRFLGGVGLFLVAQVAYIVVFRRVGLSTGKPLRRWLMAPYVAWWVGFLVLFLALTGPDPLLVAVAVYGVALAAMAYLATGVTVTTGIGAALFLASDTLIGLGGFADVELPLHDVWVMLTYTLGQGLIIVGLLRHQAALVNLDRRT